jgi:uncharacterized paraquat-inducible protein A
MPAARISTYRGPACPACNAELELPALRDGAQTCAKCGTSFEARVFHPPQRSARVLQLAQLGPDGATSCANHARNAAVANCERCGLFICSLCEISIEDGTFCPSCFDRMSKEGRVAGATTRFRDYASLAITMAIFSLIMFPLTGIPLGSLSIYYVVKGFRNRDTATAGKIGLVLALLMGLGGIVAGLFFLVMIIAPKVF